jgi:hypothetical protein
VLLMRCAVEVHDMKSNPTARFKPVLELTTLDADNVTHQSMLMLSRLEKLASHLDFDFRGDDRSLRDDMRNAHAVISDCIGKIARKTVTVEHNSLSNTKEIKATLEKMEKYNRESSAMVQFTLLDIFE